MDDREYKPIKAAKIKRVARTRGVLYSAIRQRLGVSQPVMATLTGLTRGNLVYRELNKRLYSLDEIVMLKRISGMSDTDFLQLLEELA